VKRTLTLAVLMAGTLGWLAPQHPWIVALGDSITARSGSYAERAALAVDRPLQNVAVSGAVSSEIARQPMMAGAVTVIVNAGTNDVWYVARHPSALAARLAQYDSILAVVRRVAPNARLVIVTVRDLGAMGPQNGCSALALTWASHRWAEHQRAVAHELDATVLDLGAPRYYMRRDFPDRTHPSSIGSALLAAALVPLLEVK
jgi:hypothetical protein